MLHHKRSPGVQAPARVRGRCAGLGCAPARPGSARCAGEQVWLIPCCKLLANREFKLAAPSQHRRQPGRGGAGSCRGNPANLGAGCSPPPHALSGKPCPAGTGLARVRQPRPTKQIVPASQRQQRADHSFRRTIHKWPADPAHRAYRRILAHCRRSALVTNCDPIPGPAPREAPSRCVSADNLRTWPARDRPVLRFLTPISASGCAAKDL